MTEAVAACRPFDRQARIALAVLLAAGFVVRLLPALAIPTFYHPDEIYQYLEPAHRAVFGYGIVTWEWRDGTRSWLLPGIFAGIMWLVSEAGGSAAAYLTAIYTATTALSLAVIGFGFAWAWNREGRAAAITAGLVLGAWYELLYFAPRTLADTVGAHLLVAGLWAAWPGRPVDGRWRLLAAGLLFGLTVAVRINLAPAVAVAVALACRDNLRGRWLPVLAGSAAVMLAAGALDWATWGRPFHSLLGNVSFNVNESGERFGANSWLIFPERIVLTWSGLLVPMVLLIALGARRSPGLLLIAAAVVLPHLLVSHKEYRFIFAVQPFLILLAALGLQHCIDWLRRVSARPERVAPMVLALALAINVTQSMMLPFRDNWQRLTPWIEVTREIAAWPPLCGIGVQDRAFSWVTWPGYAYMHRDVPATLLGGESADGDGYATVSGYNAMLFDAREPVLPPGFTAMGCEGRTCWAARDGDCRPDPRYLMNDLLVQRGQ